MATIPKPNDGTEHGQFDGRWGDPEFEGAIRQTAYFLLGAERAEHYAEYADGTFEITDESGLLVTSVPFDKVA